MKNNIEVRGRIASLIVKNGGSIEDEKLVKLILKLHGKSIENRNYARNIINKMRDEGTLQRMTKDDPWVVVGYKDVNKKEKTKSKESLVYDNEYIRVVSKKGEDVFNEPRTMYENKFLRIDLINPNYPFLTMNKRGAVVIPYDNEGYFYLIKKIRPNVGVYYEVPRGFVENDESFEVGALRELMEETGMSAKKVNRLGYTQPDTGVMNNKVAIYSVLVEKRENYVHYDKADKDSNKVYRCKLENMMEHIAKGRIVDGYTLSAMSMEMARVRALNEK